HTQCVGKMHVHPARNLVGFHNVVLHDGYLHDKRRQFPNPAFYDDYLPWLRERLGPDADISDAGVGCNGYASRVWPWDERLHPTAFVATKSVEFLRRRDPSRPFFLKVSFHRPHSPLDPPRTYWDMHGEDNLPEPPVGDWAAREAWSYGPQDPIPEDKRSRDRARRAYHALVSQIDYELNRVFLTLDDLSLWDNTLVLFVSDHGDMLYDHTFTRKSMPMEGSAGVPLILRLPRDMRGERCGVTDGRLVELRDIFPTLCDACGVETPPNLDGRSLLREFERGHIHGEHPQWPHIQYSNHWLTDGHEKYCWFSQNGRELLFDLDRDPRELHDLAAEKPAQTARWRALLARELAGRPEGCSDGQNLLAGRPALCSLPWAGTDDAPGPFGCAVQYGKIT
ncbi:MAG: sulfatase-like hydrolase/transferase, partial [Kiritimatiellaeota bacterium]|nr:sulfatase-like hydrolase/transferase [Kiritimatiellota bacterium]